MRLGVCTALDNVALAAQAGFEYVECALNQLMRISAKEFEEILERAPDFPIPVSKSNCFLPGNLPVTGPDVDEAQIRAYLNEAFSRAHRLGVHLVVFGSGGSRKVPEGFAHEAAWRQIASFLCHAGEFGEKYGIDIAIEPLQRRECNILNYVAEATILAALVNHSRVGVLGDRFHMLAGQESLEALSQAGALLKHMHISRSLTDMSGRVYPAPEDGADYHALFHTLRAMGYTGDISVEADTADFIGDSRLAVQRLKQEMRDDL